MKKTMLWLLVICFTLAFTGASMATPWFEIGDAGALPGTAQVASLADPLTNIFGTLEDPADPFNNVFDVDMFRIHVFDPLAFSAMTVSDPGLNVADPQLFLFGLDGRGIYMNDDDESGLNGSQSLLPAGHPLGPVSAGLYFLAIGWWDNEPYSASGRMFEDLLGVAGPDMAAGGLDPVLSWDLNVFGRPDLPIAYEILLTGAGLETAIPEPATLLLVGAGLIGVLGRRPGHRNRRAGITPNGSDSPAETSRYR
jgi:hypothetical protein